MDNKSEILKVIKKAVKELKEEEIAGINIQVSPPENLMLGDTLAIYVVFKAKEQEAEEISYYGQ